MREWETEKDQGSSRLQTSCRELTVLAAAKLFYFQQQVTARAACLAASKIFALGN